jgi:hypothetical protein
MNHSPQSFGERPAETGSAGSGSSPRPQIAFVNMPFANWMQPSFALSQLANLARREFPSQVDASIYYLNQDSATYFGVDLHTSIISDFDHEGTAIGEWVFRQAAFPWLVDKCQEYFSRYYRGAKWTAFGNVIDDKRSRLEACCLRLIEKYELDKMDVVGLTTMFSQTAPSLAMARLIKERNPSTVLLLGGAKCEAPMGAVTAKHAACMDYVFSGPALRSFPKFLTHLIKGDLESLDRISGPVRSGTVGNIM